MAMEQHDFVFRPNEIGGSEVAAILGESKYETALDVFQRKLNGNHTEVTPRQARTMKRGHHMEDFVIQELREEALNNRNQIIDLQAREEAYEIHDRDGRAVITSHPDARFQLKSASGVKRQNQSMHLLEIKTTRDRTMLHQPHADVSSDLKSPHIPRYWEIQVQMEKHGANQKGTEVAMTTLAVYDLLSDDIKQYQIEYDKEWCEEMVEKVSAWKRTYLDNEAGRSHTELAKMILNEASEADHPHAAKMKDALPKILGLPGDPEKVLDIELLHPIIQIEIEDALVDRADAEAQKKEIDQRIKEANTTLSHIIAMEDATGLCVDGNEIVSYGLEGSHITGAKQIDDMRNSLLSADEIERMGNRAMKWFYGNPDANRPKPEDLRAAIRVALPHAVNSVAKDVKERSTSIIKRTLRMSSSKQARESRENLIASVRSAFEKADAKNHLR